MRQDKNCFISKQCEEIEAHSVTNRSSDFFKAVKRITKKFTARVDAVKDKEGKVLYEDEDIKGRWKEYCYDLYREEDDNDQEDQNIDQEQSNDHHENGDCQQEEQLGMIGGFEINEREPEPLLKEVIQALREIRHGKSPDKENIPVEL